MKLTSYAIWGRCRAIALNDSTQASILFASTSNCESYVDGRMTAQPMSKLRTITDMRDKMRPVHPGEILREDVLAPLGMSARQFALALGVPANRVSQILASERAITADTALRLGRLLASKPDFWLRLQARYDLKTQEGVASAKIAREVKPLSRKVLAAAGASMNDSA